MHMDSRMSQIADAYHRATVGDAWYGPSLEELLKKISAELAAVPPVPGSHSILELLQHLLLWNDRVLNATDEHPMPKWQADKEWAEPPIPWKELLAHWHKSRDLLEERIRKFPVGDLKKQVAGRDYDYEVLLRGIVEHAIYHSGQIAMVLSMLKRRAR